VVQTKPAPNMIIEGQFKPQWFKPGPRWQRGGLILNHAVAAFTDSALNEQRIHGFMFESELGLISTVCYLSTNHTILPFPFSN
jgi:hypothetical protein